MSLNSFMKWKHLKQTFVNWNLWHDIFIKHVSISCHVILDRLLWLLFSSVSKDCAKAKSVISWNLSKTNKTTNPLNSPSDCHLWPAVWDLWGRYLSLQAHLITFQVLPDRSLLEQFVPQLIHLCSTRKKAEVLIFKHSNLNKILSSQKRAGVHSAISKPWRYIFRVVDIITNTCSLVS